MPIITTSVFLICLLSIVFSPNTGRGVGHQILIFQSVTDDGDRVKGLHLLVVIALNLNFAQRFKVLQHLGLTEYYKIAILTIQLYLKIIFMCDVSIHLQIWVK